METESHFSSVGQRADEYCAMLVRRGRKESTAKAVKVAVRRCSEWLEAHGVTDPSEVSVEDVAQMAQGLHGKESSRRQWLSGFAGYMRWLTGRDIVAQARLLWNPPQGGGRTWIDAEQYRRAMISSEPRERLIMALGATMGLRRAEVSALTLSDVRGGLVRIHGKGHGEEGKVVEMQMSEAVRTAIGSYLPVRPRSDDPHLLLTYRGNPMDVNSIYSAIRRVSEREGIDFTMHTLRRLYATTLADAGVPLETIARMMRHESPVTTMRCYLKADPKRMRAAQARVDAILATP